MKGDYFGGVMRSAGLAGVPALASPVAPVASGEPIDPFEAVDVEGIAAADVPLHERPVVASPSAGESPAPLPVRAEAPLPSQPRVADVARDASPNVQAALRWIAAGEPAQELGAQSPARPAPLATAKLDAGAERTPTPAVAAAAILRTEPAREAAVARPIAQPEPSPAAQTLTRPAERASLPVASDDGPRRSRSTEPVQRAAPARAAAEIHIGTLHVTLDAAATARFAAPRTVVAAPEAPRANAPRPAAAAAGGGISSLSRSRLPRW